MTDNGPSDAAVTLATTLRHRELVRLALRRVAVQLEQRGLLHDLSKWSEDELSGFVRINRVAREHAYGSEEYRASMRREEETIRLHYSRNSHHPEYHDDIRQMGVLDLLEMVCDWWAASITYGKISLADSLEVHRERFDFSPEQWWVIEQFTLLFETSE